MSMTVPTAQERRLYSRYRPDGLTCNLGEVVDISTTGLRILSKRQREGSQTVVLQASLPGTSDSRSGGKSGRATLRLPTRVVWRRRLGFREHVLGLAFDELDAAAAQQLKKLVDGIGRGEAVRPARGVGLRHWWLGLCTALAGVALVAAGVGLETESSWATHWLAPMRLWHSYLFWAGLGAGGLLVITGLSEMLRHQQDAPAATLAAARQAQPPGRQDEIQQLRSSQHLLNCILESSLGGVAVLKAIRAAGERAATDFEIQLVNRAAETLIGRSEALLVGRRVSQTLPCLATHSIFTDLVCTTSTGLPVQKEYRLDNGRWVQLAVVQLGDGLAVTFADTSEQHHAQARLRHVAYHDELTGLPNRKLLLEHLERAFIRSKRYPSHKFGVLFLDFDRFKIVNDTLGHEVGDQLLNSISDRLRENIRSVDTAALAGQDQLPARLGGDEFVVMLDGISGIDDATTVARRLLEAFKQPHMLNNHRVVSTASIGIVLSNDSYNSVDDLLRDADTAMYEAKHSGKARYVVFDQRMHETLIEQARLERDLRDAVAREDFQLVYEPIVSLESGNVAGFEALIRWNHPTRGPVPPCQFIPLAEELNLIGPVGEWVIKQGCAQLHRWHADGHHDLFLNLNLSRAQLYDTNLVETLEEQIALYTLNPQRLSLEITETMVMNDVSAMTEKLRELKALGVRLALDDFGTGHSSLNVLQVLPLDILKIDRTFIENAGEAVRRYGAIIGTITELARNLDMEVVAEGIERIEQVALLQSLGCEFAQGWLFSRALSADQAMEMVTERPKFGAVAA